jgi:MFS family permease
MIRTGQKRVPWFALILLCLVSGVAHLIDSAVGGNPMGLLLSRFTVNPVTLSWIGVIAPAMALLVSPYVSWKSDRIWTRWGRRKPFIIVGLMLAAVALCLTPFATNIWMLIVAIVFLYVGNDVGYQGPFAPLLYEIVPSPQRGRAAVIKKYAMDLTKLSVGVLLLRQWDNIYSFAAHGVRMIATTTPAQHVAAAITDAGDGGKAAPSAGEAYQFSPSFLPKGFHVELTGVYILYFTTALIVALTCVAIAFGVEETKPEKALPAERFNPWRFMVTLSSDRQMIMVAVLIFCASTLNVALTGYLTTVMLKHQFGYRAKDLASIYLWTNLILTVVVLPVAISVSDRIDRRVLYRWGLVLGTLHHLAMWVVIRMVGIPPVWLWIVMIGLGILVDTVAGLALEPLVFDMIPREKMGTINSGFLLINKILGMIIGPLIGFFIWCYSFAISGWSTKNLKWDYSSGFLVYFVMGLIGCGFYFFYVEPQWRKGQLTDGGTRERETVAVPTGVDQ